tara:strand:+ start:3770 stop:4507 length:738 start_codon:yes stop_codon:yes gene_type:complete
MFGLITVKTSSKRLPNKCLLPFGNETVISHVIKRAIDYGIIPIVCTSNDSSDDVLQKLSEDLGVKCFRGSLVNKMKRWLDCAKKYNLKTFHSIDADDPFFDGELMIESMKYLKNNNLDVVCPTKSSSMGSASVGYSIKTKILEDSLKNINENEDTEMIWNFLNKVANIQMKELPESKLDTNKVRLTLDYEEDYLLLTAIVRILGNKATRKEVERLLIRNPDLYKINFFRNKEWKNLQLSKGKNEK